MKGGKLLGVVAAVALGLGMLVLVADAKEQCGRLCRDEVGACMTVARDLRATCRELAEDRAARRGCREFFRMARPVCRQIRKGCQMAPADDPVCEGSPAARP